MTNKPAHEIKTGDFILDDAGKSLRVTGIANESRVYGAGMLRIQHNGGIGYSVIHKNDLVEVGE